MYNNHRVQGIWARTIPSRELSLQAGKKDDRRKGENPKPTKLNPPIARTSIDEETWTRKKDEIIIPTIKCSTTVQS